MKIPQQYCVFIKLLVLSQCLREISGRQVVKLSENSERVGSEARLIDRESHLINRDADLEDNDVLSKYYPAEDHDSYGDYPSSYYGDMGESIKYRKPGLHYLHGLRFLKWKVWIWSLAKILFKVIIVKKIVIFVILTFLLIFVPTIFSLFSFHGGYGPGNHGLFRRFNYEKSENERINDLAAFVLTSIESFQSSKECTEEKEEFQCRLRNMFKTVAKKYPLNKVFNNYLKVFDEKRI